MKDRFEWDLRDHHGIRHMRIVHGEEIPPGTPNRRRLSQKLHDDLHRLDHAGHALHEWGTE